MVTLKEIAQECNVSATTVSNILNGKPKVSEETRLKVLDVVKRRGYQPNYIAQGLRNQKTRTIGIIAEDIAQFSTPGMIESIMAFCEEKGYRTIVQNLRLYARWQESWFNNEEAYRSVLEPALQELRSIKVDGLIYVAGHARIIHFFKEDLSMPQEDETGDTILLHEFVHIRRFDAVKKLFATAALCIHWFNPAVWIMYSLFSRDIELACDEAVIRHTGLDAKANYARVLIAMEEKKSGLAPLCSSFSKNSIEERITAIMKAKRTTLFSIILASLIIFTAAGMFATSAIASNKNPGENAVESAFTQNQADPELYAVYEPFGLTVEEKTGKLYYKVN